MNEIKKNIEPLVTVNILSFNRKDELHFTLTKVFEQDYKNIEVIGGFDEYKYYNMGQVVEGVLNLTNNLSQV